jgi:hypothetical protein
LPQHWRCDHSRRRPSIGRVRWSGPDGIEVALVEVTRDGRTLSYYRLRQWGKFIADLRTIDQLAQHVDLSRLTEA